jgi:hypothetical protein
MKIILTRTKSNVVCTLIAENKVKYCKSFGAFYKKQTIKGGLSEYFRILSISLGPLINGSSILLVSRGLSPEDIFEFLLTFNKAGIIIASVRDATPVAFNGCFNKKGRRV